MPDMHCKGEYENDISNLSPKELLHKWFYDEYSTSKHLWTLYSIAVGLRAETMIEVGFGRSTIALAAAARYNSGYLYCCDRYNYVPMIPEFYYPYINYTVGDAKDLLKKIDFGVEFIFLDYLSSRERSADSCVKAIYRFLEPLKQNGIIAVHDSIEPRYNVKDAFKKLRKDKNLEVLSLPYNYGLGLIRKLGKSEYGKIEDQWHKKSDSYSNDL